jgi:hypothetical protein
MKVALLSNAAAGNGADVVWPGGVTVMAAEATFGGGNVKLQIKLDQGTYADIASSTLSAAGITAALYLPQGTYRAVAATGSAFYASLLRVKV